MTESIGLGVLSRLDVLARTEGDVIPDYLPETVREGRDFSCQTSWMFVLTGKPQ